MKNTTSFLLILSVIFISSCRKDKSETIVIKTGDKLGYYCNKIDSIAPRNTWYDSDSIDINEDGKYDICLRVSSINAPSGHEYASRISIIDTTFQFIVTSDSISPKILNIGDTIDNNKRWLYQPGFQLARDYCTWVNPSESLYLYWNQQTAYIGVRNEYKKGHYKFGWIKISVESICFVKIYEYSYEK